MMDNILNFPFATIVNKTVPKKAIYSRSKDSSLRDALTNEFESIIWLYKLAPSTLNIEAGKYVQEIDVFYCAMKVGLYNAQIFCTIDELLPRHTIFIIEYSNKIDLLMHHKEMRLVSKEEKWECVATELKRDLSIGNFTLNIQGLSMDVVYSHLLSQVSGLAVSTQEDYKAQVKLREQLEIYKQQVSLLQKKIKAEKQFNRQIELSTQVRQIKKEIALLTDKLSKDNT